MEIPKSQVIMHKIPLTKCIRSKNGYTVSFADKDIKISIEGRTKKEAYFAFLDYLFAIIPELEEDKTKLSKHLKIGRVLIKKYFEQKLIEENGKNNNYPEMFKI